jgi:hypothetical protein
LSPYDNRHIFRGAHGPPVAARPGQALDFLREAEDVTGPDPFPTELLDRLRELVRCDSVSHCELDRPHERTLLLGGCARAREIDISLDAQAAFWRLRHEHPVCAHQDRADDFAPLKLSDFLTRAQLWKTVPLRLVVTIVMLVLLALRAVAVVVTGPLAHQGRHAARDRRRRRDGVGHREVAGADPSSSA